MQQLLLFNTYDYDTDVDYFKKLVETSPRDWDIKELETRRKRCLKLICIKYKLPHSGNKAKLLNGIKGYIDLAIMVNANFRIDKKTGEPILKEKPPYTVKRIKPILKRLNIRNSWLNKPEKLLLAKNQLIERINFRPNWEKYWI